MLLSLWSQSLGFLSEEHLISLNAAGVPADLSLLGCLRTEFVDLDGNIHIRRDLAALTLKGCGDGHVMCFPRFKILLLVNLLVGEIRISFEK